MIQSKANVKFARKIDIDMFKEIQNADLKSDLKNCKYEDMRLLGVQGGERNAKEDRRDFSFVITRRDRMFVENVATKKVYNILCEYTATFQNDRLKVLSVREVTKENIFERMKKDRERAYVQMSEYEEEYILNIFVFSSLEDEKYKYVEYAYYLDWYSEEEEEEDYGIFE